VATGTFYFQECPTCGRSLQIRVEYLGRVVVCQHCGGSLQARDPASPRWSIRTHIFWNAPSSCCKRPIKCARSSRTRPCFRRVGARARSPLLASGRRKPADQER